jgi:transposase-like protein
LKFRAWRVKLVAFKEGMNMAETTAPTFRATPEQWEGLLGEYSSSGKSIQGFCRDNGIPHHQMHYHMRRARKAQSGDGFIELLREAPGNLWVEAGSCRIRVERGFDAELLRQVATALSCSA